jgi:hypothetical protein
VIPCSRAGGAAAVLACAAAWPQAPADSQITIGTDRPAIANSSVVVPQGALQVENGLLSTDAGGRHALDLPESNIRYGLLQDTELRLTWPDYYRGFPQAGAGISGFGDSAIGLKQQLGPVGGFDLSAIAFTSVPSGAAGLSSRGYDPGVQLPWSRKLTDDWTAAGQLAAYWPTQGGKRNATREATFLVDRRLNARWDAFVEYAGDFPHAGGSRQLLHAGAACMLTAHQQLDFHAAAGLSAAAPRSFVGVGYSFLFVRLGRAGP